MQYDLLPCKDNEQHSTIVHDPPSQRSPYRFARTITLFILGNFSLPSSPAVAIPFLFASFSLSRSRFMAETATPVDTAGECRGSRSSRFGMG